MGRKGSRVRGERKKKGGRKERGWLRRESKCPGEVHVEQLQASWISMAN